MYERALRLMGTPAAAFLALLGVVDAGASSSVGVGIGVLLLDLGMAVSLFWAAWVRAPKVGLAVLPDGFRMQRLLRNCCYAREEVERFEVCNGVVYLIPLGGLRVAVHGLGTWTWARSGRTFEFVDELNAMLPANSASAGATAGAV